MQSPFAVDDDGGEKAGPRLRFLQGLLGVVTAICISGLVVSYLRLLDVRRVRETLAQGMAAGDDVFFLYPRKEQPLLRELDQALRATDDRVRADACRILARFIYGAEFFSDEVWDFSPLVEPLGACAAAADPDLRRNAALAASLLYVPSVRYGEYWKQAHDLTRVLVGVIADGEEEVRLAALAGLRLYGPFASDFWRTCSLAEWLPHLTGIERALDVSRLAGHLKDAGLPAPLQLYLLELLRGRREPDVLPALFQILESRAGAPASLIQVRSAALALDIVIGAGTEAVVPLVARARLTDNPALRSACVDGLARLAEDPGVTAKSHLRELLLEQFVRGLDADPPYVRLRSLKGLSALGYRFEDRGVTTCVIEGLGETLSRLNQYGADIDRARAAGWTAPLLRELAGAKAGLATVALAPSPVEVYDRLLAEQVAVLNAIDPKGSAPAVVRAVRAVFDENHGERLSLALDDPPDGPLSRFLAANAGPELLPLLSDLLKVKNGTLLYWTCRTLAAKGTAPELDQLGHLVNHLDYRDLAPWVICGLEKWVRNQDLDPAALRETASTGSGAGTEAPGAGGPGRSGGNTGATGAPASWDRAVVERRAGEWRTWWKEFRAKRRVIITPYPDAGGGGTTADPKPR
ncbi:MAG: hypothetical protein HZA54_11485 [Planctomycetes bacterium]|nr:hypothetical protein [Planctomycetota bacterium]